LLQERAGPLRAAALRLKLKHPYSDLKGAIPKAAAGT
jgi:hypothetical protein